MLIYAIIFITLVYLKTGPRILHISHTLNKIATLLAANGGGNDIAVVKRKSFE